MSIYLALGSNLSWKERKSSEILSMACAALKEKGLCIKAYSSMYASPSWPDSSQPAYVNAVIEIESSLEPQDLLALCQEVEAYFGRQRGQDQNAPRTLDIDIMLYGNMILDLNNLIIPHPRMQDRAFVLRPLMDLAPDLRHPKLNKSIKDLYKSLQMAEKSHIKPFPKDKDRNLWPA